MAVAKKAISALAKFARHPVKTTMAARVRRAESQLPKLSYEIKRLQEQLIQASAFEKARQNAGDTHGAQMGRDWVLKDKARLRKLRVRMEKLLKVIGKNRSNS